MAITRRNFVEAAGAAATLAALAACDTTTPETPADTPQGSEPADTPADEPADEPVEEPEDEGPKGHDLSEYPLDPDGDDVEALWSEENTKDGWTRVTQEAGGKELGYWPDGGCKIIQVDGYAFKDLNGNGKLDAYEDWRLTFDERATNLSELIDIERFLPMMYHGAMLGSSAPLDDSTLELLASGSRGASTRSNPNGDNYAAVIEWINAVQAACEGDVDNYGIPYLCSCDPYYLFNVPSCQGAATSFDKEIMKKSADIMSKVWRTCGIRILLGPQIDLITTPNWTRGSGSITEDPALARDMACAYISGLQSTWDDDGNDLGWGEYSVAGMMKHYFGAGAAEGGRNDHNEYAKYCAHPGDNLLAHLVPFIDGGLHLDSKTEEVASVMPNYGIPYTVDEHYGENVGGGFSKYKIDFLRVNADYDGMILTDFGIAGTGGQGIRNWGRENNSTEENLMKILEVGCDIFGGEWGLDEIKGFYELLKDTYGQDEADVMIRNAARRLFVVLNKVDLFDQPYSDRTKAQEVFKSDKIKEDSMEIQLASIALIKNKGNLIREHKDDKPTVYIPMKYIEPDPWAAMMGGNSDPAHWGLPLDEDLANELFDVVTDTILEPSGDPDDDGNPTYTANDIERLSADDLKEIDFCLYFADAPDCRAEGFSSRSYPDGNFVPISLIYGEYTADSENVRDPSWAGNVWTEDSKFEENPETGRENWTYKGNTGTNNSIDTLNNIIATKELCGDAPLVLVVHANCAFCCYQFEELCDGILVYFGDQVTGDAVCQIVGGKVEPRGMLIMQLPKDMDEVEKQYEDVPRDMEPHEDTEGNVYDFAFGLNWSGQIKDERWEKYSAEPLTKPETIDV